jgi:hypothetical protein
MFSGDIIYPNVYLAFWGTTGDKKTTAQRAAFRLGLPEEIKIIQNVGSTEGLCEALQDGASDPSVYLFYWEEMSSLLSRARWSGSTLLDFLTTTYDCPSEWGLKYRKNPISLINPTPSILTGTTPEWFWKNAREEDFYGGFGNRFLFLTGTKKAPMPDPRKPDHQAIMAVRQRVHSLSLLPTTEACWHPDAKKLFSRFYIDWDSRTRDGLLDIATKRTHAYIRKLAMTYAAIEATLPTITTAQLAASIAVAVYASDCAERLLDLRQCKASDDLALEQKIVKWVQKNPGSRVRYLQQAMSKYAKAETFNKTLHALAQAEQIRVESGKERRVFPGD